jgi:transcription-repair coupling factor (superfamily II helicase)
MQEAILNKIANVAEGASLLAARTFLTNTSKSLIFIANHDKQLAYLTKNAKFFLPEFAIITLPAWDCLPYDRSSPSRHIMARRANALGEIINNTKRGKQFVILTTTSAFIQKLPSVVNFAGARLDFKVGEEVAHDILAHFLNEYGYRRVSKVMEAGEYALRGNIIDIFPANFESPYRLDLFGDVIESIKPFDVITQRTEKTQLNELTICNTSELRLGDKSIKQFKQQYLLNFGTPKTNDTLYHAVCSGNHYAGAEHYLPFFYAEPLISLKDFAEKAEIMLDHGVIKTLEERLELINDYYDARLEQVEVKASSKVENIYNPIAPDKLYLGVADLSHILKGAHALYNFDIAGAGDNFNSRPAKQIYATSKTSGLSPFEHLGEELAKNEGITIIAASSSGSLERLQHLLHDNKLSATKIENHQDLRGKKSGFFIAEIELGRGFVKTSANNQSNLSIYSEEDLLGKRIIQVRRRRGAVETFMMEASSFEVGELLVHIEHGIGRFSGLETVSAGGIRHDCIKLTYRDGDKLFLPVENMDLITRHGGELSDSELDKLGAGSWQSRKAAYKAKLRLSAEELLKIAAARELSKTNALTPIPDSYDNFISGFPYEPTEDQANAIEDVLADLSGSKPMDRLICGDVGFGKTEVALRAAFVAASDAVSPCQVAFIAPTTLLVRQHFHHVRDRFAGTGLKIAQLSRLITAKQAGEVREGLESGKIDIVVGTHALLAESVHFARLGLLIIDEEQRFGVKQKERLKKLKSDIHVLTMSATPIPRTLQMSLTGVRDLSLITTPPVDRLAVRSFVMPYDFVVLREAIMRELNRGGIVFYVTPRISDLPELQEKITKLAPNARLAIAHGQMSPAELDSVMNDVYDGKCDILLSTAIIESGIDIPTANTMIINRADKFGLAQLYQLRGRVGRGKVRAYAYFTIPHHGAMTPDAVRRLQVMQSLDSLGAGFTLASHDMDIRGFGNLVGEEQSGHVKEIGIELYQQMLSEAVAEARLNAGAEIKQIEDWSPQLNLGLPIFIPETYIDDLSLRISLYRRASNLRSESEIESFAAEMSDRFGRIPQEVEYLFTVLKLKLMCKNAGIAKLELGPKGAVIGFNAASIKKPEALIGFINARPKKMKMRPDNSIFYANEWQNDAHKLEQIKRLIEELTAL